jgi:hypothetical protein
MLFLDEAVDEQAAGSAAQSASWVQQIIHAMPQHFDRGVAADPTRQCGTCANMTADGWCRLRRFDVTPTLPACEFYVPIPARRFGPGT